MWVLCYFFSFIVLRFISLAILTLADPNGVMEKQLTYSQKLALYPLDVIASLPVAGRLLGWW